jgi:hypothetical protein
MLYIYFIQRIGCVHNDFFPLENSENFEPNLNRILASNSTVGTLKTVLIGLHPVVRELKHVGGETEASPPIMREFCARTCLQSGHFLTSAS